MSKNDKAFRWVMYHVTRDIQSFFRSSGRTFTALGIEAGITDAAISQYMHDVNGLKFETLQRVCAGFGLNIDLKWRNKGRTIRFVVTAESAEIAEAANDQLVLDGRPRLNIPVKPLFSRPKRVPTDGTIKDKPKAPSRVSGLRHQVG